MASTDYLLAQNDSDSLLKRYSDQLIGTWVRQNNVIDGRVNEKDTTIKTYDTLMFFANKTYFFRQGANLDKNWIGSIDKGNWFLQTEFKPIEEYDIKTVLRLKPNYSNIPLPLTNYSYSIINITATEFTFYYYKRVCRYQRIE
ncbi:MAG: hypothetical protein M3R17_01360 [Bacteroidota bacterium]|nr:hypothetical protein [Bacteroidota bacterium]